MTRDDVVELPGAHGVDGLRPGARETIVEIGEKTDDRVARSHGFLRGRKHLNVARRMSLAVKRQLELAGAVFDDVGPGAGRRWGLQRLALHFFLVRRELAQLIVAPFPLLRSCGSRQARSHRIDQTRHAVKRFLQPVALELRHVRH